MVWAHNLCVNNVSAITHLDDWKSKLTNQKQPSFPQSQRSAAPNSGTSPTTTKAHRPYRDFQRAVHHIIDTSRRPRLGGIVRGKARNDASEGSKWRVYEPWPAAKQPRQKRMSRARKGCGRCARVCATGVQESAPWGKTFGEMLPSNIGSIRG